MKQNETSKMLSKFGVSDHVKNSQVEIILQCKGLLNLSMCMHLAIVCSFFFFDLQLEFHNELPLKNEDPKSFP